VEAMMIHAASFVAFFVGQLAQATAVVQYAPAAPEPTLKWLLPTIVQTVVSLLSIFAGVGIAVRSFRANKRIEHEQWIRDQKKAEWKELLAKIAEIEHETPIIIDPQQDHQNLESIAQGILPLLRGTIFVFPALESADFIAKWVSFVKYVSGQFITNIQIYRSVQAGTTPGNLIDWTRIKDGEEKEVRVRFHALIEELRTLAHHSLEIK
jgi:hypothetical protein